MNYIETSLLGLAIVLGLNILRLLILKIANMTTKYEYAKLDIIETILIIFFIGVLVLIFDVAISAKNEDLESRLVEILDNTSRNYIRLSSIRSGFDTIIAYLEAIQNYMLMVNDYALMNYNLLSNRFAGFDVDIAGVSYRSIQNYIELIEGKEKIAKALADLSFIIRTSFNIVLILGIVISLLEFIKLAFPVFFYTGLVLRSFYITSGLGALLLSMSISFYFVFPILFFSLINPPSMKVTYSYDSGISLVVDGETYLTSKNYFLDFTTIIESSSNSFLFLSNYYNLVVIALLISTGISLGIVYYGFLFLGRGGLLWAAPTGLLRLL